MVRYKGDYKKESYCPKCEDWTPEPLIKSIYEYLRYGYMVAVREASEYPRVYDDKGNLYDVQTLIPIKQVNRYGLDGTLFEEITEFRSPVKCQYCGKICRVGSYSKTGAKNHYEPSWRGPKRGRPKGPDKEKEDVDYWVERINETKGTRFEVTLDDVPLHLRSKVKRKIEKENEGKESNIDN